MRLIGRSRRRDGSPPDDALLASTRRLGAARGIALAVFLGLLVWLVVLALLL